MRQPELSFNAQRLVRWALIVALAIEIIFDFGDIAAVRPTLRAGDA